MELQDELNLGHCAEKGFLKESYSEVEGDLKYDFTTKGLKELKQMLSEQKFQKIFVNLMKEKAKTLPEEAREPFVRKVISDLHSL